MEAPPETKTPVGTKRSSGWWLLIVWPLVILLLYVLSFGPVFLLFSKGSLSPRNKFIFNLYHPLFWAHARTPLRKPLGMYLHLWVPQIFDKNGDHVDKDK
jgi:hypothetical protein